MERERSGSFDNLHDRPDLKIGDNVEFEMHKRIIEGLIEGLTSSGRAIVSTMIGCINVDAEALMRRNRV